MVRLFSFSSLYYDVEIYVTFHRKMSTFKTFDVKVQVQNVPELWRQTFLKSTPFPMERHILWCKKKGSLKFKQVIVSSITIFLVVGRFRKMIVSLAFRIVYSSCSSFKTVESLRGSRVKIRCWFPSLRCFYRLTFASIPILVPSDPANNFSVSTVQYEESQSVILTWLPGNSSGDSMMENIRGRVDYMYYGNPEMKTIDMLHSGDNITGLVANKDYVFTLALYDITNNKSANTVQVEYNTSETG